MALTREISGNFFHKFRETMHFKGRIDSQRHLFKLIDDLPVVNYLLVFFLTIFIETLIKLMLNLNTFSDLLKQ